MPLLDDPKTYIDGAQLLEKAGQITIAAALLNEAERQFPNSEAIFWRRTEFIERHHGADAGFARWVLMSCRFPGSDRVLANLTRRHSRAGRLGTAERIVTDALAAMPNSQVLLGEAPHLARARGDLHAAARRWKEALQRRPRWPEAVRAHNMVVAEINVRALDRALETPALPAPANDGYALEERPDATTLRDLFARFESLGNGGEFGSVQRHFGAEPLSLLRWATIPAPALVRALDNGLQQLLEPDDAFLIPHRFNYHVRVPRARFEMHTLVEPEHPDAFLEQIRRRLRYLARRLLEDLRAGEKIFVFKDTASQPDASAASAIHAAVRRHGPGQVLSVLAADQDHPTGSLERRPDGLWIGRMPRGSTHETANHEAWLTICGAIAEAVPAAAQTVQ